MTTTQLRFDAKEFIPLTTPLTTPSYNSPDTSPNLQPKLKQKHRKGRNPRSRHDRIHRNQHINRRSESNLELSITPLQEESPNDSIPTIRTVKSKNSDKHGTSRKKKQVQQTLFKKNHESKHIRSEISIGDEEKAHDRLQNLMDFPELPPSIHIAPFEKGRPDGSSQKVTNDIWSKAKSLDLLRKELITETSSMIDDSNDLDLGTSCISQLVPLLQPLQVAQMKSTVVCDSSTRKTAPIKHSRNGSFPLVDERPQALPKVRKPLVPFDKLRDRWWNLLLVHEQEKQRLAETQFSPVELPSPLPLTQNSSNRSSSSLIHNQEMGSSHESDIGGCSRVPCDVLSSNQPDCSDLFDAIQRDDTKALKRLIASLDSTDLNALHELEQLSPLQVAVKLNRSHHVRIICQAMEQKKCFPKSEVNLTPIAVSKMNPLLMAADFGHHESLLAIISVLGVSLLLTNKDTQGNTVMHYACRSGNGSSTFQCILNYITASCPASNLFKIFSCRNNQLQTPLHIAAHYDRVDIIDILLNHRYTSSISFLSKLLTIHDIEKQTPLLAAIASGSSDVVMSLLMWRGNNCSLKPSSPYAVNGNTSVSMLITSSACCPLIWAVKFKDIDMVKLLLEFNDPSSGSGYKMNDALHFCVNFCSVEEEQANDSSLFEIIRVLVEAGANPCTSDIFAAPKGLAGSTRNQSSTIVLAVSQRKLKCLTQLLDSYENFLVRIRNQRRHDPKLQNQPESFFLGIEMTEDAEQNTALREALLLSLSMACLSSKSNISYCLSYIQCCLLLYEKNVELDCSELLELKASLLSPPLVKEFVRDHVSLTYPYISKMDTKPKDNCSWSRVMMGLPWFDLNSFAKCALFASSRDTNIPSNETVDVQPDVIIVCNDGEILGHEVILSQSHKFAAAIRFARLSDNQDQRNRHLSTIQLIKVKVDSSSNVCRRHLEHLYHGSLATSFTEDCYAFCKDLLELMLVGDEYICLSLIHECLLRFLSSVDEYDRCFCNFCYGSMVSVDNVRNFGRLYLVSSETVLDLLDVLQYISCFANDDRTESNNDIRKLVTFLRENALCIAICKFSSVVKSETFESMCNHSSKETFGLSLTAPEMLLYTLLNDLADLWQNG